MPTRPRHIRLIAPLFARHRLRLLVGVAALLGVDLCQLLIPRVVRSAIDGLQMKSIDIDGLRTHALAILALAAGVALCRFLWRYMILGFSRLAEETVRNRLAAHLLRMDRAFFQRRPTGELMALASNDLMSIQILCGMGLIALIDAVVMTLAAIGFMVSINPRLTAMAILPLPALAVITKLLSKRLHRRFAAVQRQFAVLTETARGAISAIRLIKVNGREDEQVRRFGREGERYIDRALRVARVQGALMPVSGAVANISLLIIMYAGGGMAIHGQISIGDFVAFISYLFMMTWPMMAIGWVANVFQRGMTSLERIGGVLDERPVLRDAAAATRPDRPLAPPIKTHSLTFRYPGGETDVLRGLSLAAGPGITAIAGPTGAGKSTVCHILARLYPVADGTITVAGVDINKIPIARYRDQVAYAPQEPLLFSRTIAENIALGRPRGGMEEIEQAARAAAIHEEITALPSGYATRIGEKGVLLSGGQRQRLALARALYSRAPLLILDDTLSAVDTVTEQRVTATLRQYARQHMVVIVSHRLSPLLAADRVVIIENGRVTAQGSPEEVMASSDFFRAMHAAQTARPGGDI